jgi:pimeloyl-ACP methyl ester carboxylesterase
MEPQTQTLETRLGPVASRSSGSGPALVFFAGALANGELWRDIVGALEDRYRCITIDLPLGAGRWPLAPGADRSATSLARLELDCLELLDVNDATVVANDTAGGLLLLSLASGHPALGRVGRLVLTNCESYEHFPPDSLKKAASLCRTLPWAARTAIWTQLWLASRSPAIRRRGQASVTATDLSRERAESIGGPALHDRRVIGDFVAAMAGFRPQLLLDAATEIPRFDRPVLLVWGEECRFFPMAHAQRLASDFPSATLVSVPGARTWVMIDNPAAVAGAIAKFVPTPVP